MPLAALGGRADVMDLLAPLGPVYQAGTLSGNPVAVAAGLATLRLADAGGLRAGRRRGRTIVAAALDDALAAAGVAHAVPRAGNLFSRRLPRPSGAARLRRGAGARRRGATRRSSTRCSTPGVSLPPSVFEAWFLTAAHDDDALGRIVEALPAAARAAAQALGPVALAQ